MSRFHSLSLAIALAGLFPHTCLGAPDLRFPNGKFFREGSNFGELTISHADKKHFNFHLLVELNLGGDGGNDRMGGIEDALATVQGDKAQYNQKPDSDGFYDQCTLTFRRMARYIVVEQDGTCLMWGFGHQVSAAGKYRLKRQVF